MKRKPKVRPSASGYGWMCSGLRDDLEYAFGWGPTIEEAYADWLKFDPNDIPF